MKRIYSIFHCALSIMLLCACTKPQEVSSQSEPLSSVDTREEFTEGAITEPGKEGLYYLALGDSYTAGTGVSASESFPMLLEKYLEQELGQSITTRVIATAGWRTDNLLNALNDEPQEIKYDMVTLLIGVNNQFQERPFKQYRTEFPQLLARAVAFANGNVDRVTVISIPDYAFTPFGASFDPKTISKSIDKYNLFASETAEKTGVEFIDITDITRNGLDDPELVASDRLHPSGKAYKKFVERIGPIIAPRLKD